jgi:hypothetical protein
MFVQVIQGHISDPDQARAAFDTWIRDLAPGAQGWLGSTAGVTDDGTLIVLARFESEEAARRNSDRPEQDQWWTALSKNFTGQVVFHDSRDVTMDIVGDPGKAGFVQVIQGKVSDPDRARELMGSDSSGAWQEFRPDVLGSVTCGHDDGSYTTAIYFTSEADARQGEQKTPPPEIAEQMREMDSLSVGPPSFFDLKRPWLHAPK